VEPTDDLSMANPPSNAPLLDYLVEGFIAHNYDMKWLHREICLSDTYQRSWKPNDTNLHDERNFSRAVPRRLPAEAAYDALVMASASSTQAARFEEDLKSRAVSLSSPPRNNGNGSGADYALRIFGRSVRESNCDCDRSGEASLLQTVYVRNDADVLGLIDRRDGWVAEVLKQSGRGTEADADSKQLATLEQRLEELQKQASKTDNEKRLTSLNAQMARLEKQIKSLKKESPEPQVSGPPDASLLIEEAYLRTVSRFPTAEERGIAEEFLKEAADHSAGVRDLLWALLNTKEFMVNH
jgi:hypothetical protein